MHELPVQTSSLRLRHLLQQDAEEMLVLNAEPSTKHWLPSHVYADIPAAVAAMDFLISAYTEPGDPRRGPYVLGVEDAATGRLLGHVGFSPLDDDVEVSYAIAESFRGQGLGTEALIAGTEWVTRVFRLPAVVAITATANVPSRRILERSGYAHVRDELMVFQGVEEHVSRYSCAASRPSTA